MSSQVHYDASVIADEMEEIGKVIHDGPVTDAAEAIEIEEFMQRIESSIADIRGVMHAQFEDVHFPSITAQ